MAYTETRRFFNTLGPIKEEIIIGNCTNNTTFTVQTRIQNPICTWAVPTGNGVAPVSLTTTAFSGKVLTVTLPFNQTNDSSAGDNTSSIMIHILGY